MSVEGENEALVASGDAESLENTSNVEKETGADTGKSEGERERPKKDGTQKRIDRLTREKYQMKAELEMLKGMMLGGNQVQQQGDDDSIDLDALVDQRLAEREAQREAQRQSAKVQKILGEVEDLVDDFDIEDWADLPITPYMADAIIESDLSAEISAYLYNNPSEVTRIAELPKARQAAAIGKLEARLESAESGKVAAKSSAPAPIKPVAAAKASSKFRADMSLAEYAALRGRKLS